MSAPKPKKSSMVRIKPSQNGRIQEFAASRRNIVLQALKKLQIQCSQVPNIALLGSGGGQRAMVGLLGSLVELDKAGLLDCILYLSGVSGSTWCMASLYKEPDWSTKLETVKDQIVKRLSGPRVSWGDALAKLKKYYNGNNFFSLTDFWAAMVVTSYVKEIDEHTLTEHWKQQNKDPFPIYTVIDKQCKHGNDGDPWFEINPHEAGYSLTGAFVETCNFGSQFHEGSKKNHQGEFDMLYLQALCGSAFGDECENKKMLLKRIKDSFPEKETKLEAMREAQRERRERRHEEMEREMETDLEAGHKPKKPKMLLRRVSEHHQPDSDHWIPSDDDPVSQPIDECYRVLMDLVDMNLAILNGEDPSGFDKSIRTNLKDLSGGKSQLTFPMKKVNTAGKGAEALSHSEKRYINRVNMDVCSNLSDWINIWPFNALIRISECVTEWIWGRKYNFLHNLTDGAVPATLLKSETRDYIDAGLLLNSPYFSVLSEERNTDLIISLDFSQDGSFVTVENAAEMCRERNIPFPEVNITSEDREKPKDFYVFKGQKGPTVIHIPLFNVVNCGDELEELGDKYHTIQGPYSAEMITDLMNIAGKNISNNREKLKEQIQAVIREKKHRRVNNILNVYT